MRAAPGDQLIVDGDPDRVGEVIGVPNGDGSPPYVVRWRRSGHIALVSPDSYDSIIPAGTAVPDRCEPDGGRPASRQPAARQPVASRPGARR